MPTAATILLVNGAGAAIGPLLATAVMTPDGPRAAVPVHRRGAGPARSLRLYRTRVQSPQPAVDKTGFDLAATAPVGAVVVTDATDTIAPAPEPASDVTPQQPPT